MKYDVLASYRSQLEKVLQPTTAKTYCNRLEVLLEGQSVFNTLEKLDMSKILENLSKIKYKSYFSQSKNALLYFLKMHNIELSPEELEQIKHMEKSTRRKYRKLKAVEFQSINNTILHLKNKKLKLSYMILVETGLRVSELAQIQKKDCNISENEIFFYFNGKGGKQEFVMIKKEENEKLYNDLKDFINTVPFEEKIFYSAIYLQEKAKGYGFCCHDLRRACAKLTYHKTKSKKQVCEKLRHANIKTTDIYLNSKVKIK